MASYDEQLADYFAKAPQARLGILMIVGSVMVLHGCR